MVDGIYLLGGLLLLWIGGEAFVRGSVGIARRLNVSDLMIGLTLVGFGTSLPEMLTSVTAALSAAPGLAVGNVVGSNITNVLLILGVAALIRPVTCRPEAFYRDAMALVIATAACAVIILLGNIGRFQGVLLVAGLVFYITLVYRQEGTHPGPAATVLIGEAEVAQPVASTLLEAGAQVIGGMLAILGGAWILVAAATEIAIEMGVSKTFIGLTIVALGTSLPELVITGVASLRGRSEVALGNIMGSNLFNTLGILGTTALLAPIRIPQDLRLLDLVVMIAATVLLIIAAATNLRVTRWEGVTLLAGFVLFTAVRTSMAL